MIYMRGQARDYDAWAEMTGEKDWGWESRCGTSSFTRAANRFDAQAAPRQARPLSGVSHLVDPDMQRTMLPNVDELSRFHGDGGEWRVEKQRLRWEILDAFAQAAQQAGLPASDDFNAAATKAWATSKSIRRRAGAGTPPKPSCARCSASGRT